MSEYIPYSFSINSAFIGSPRRATSNENVSLVLRGHSRRSLLWTAIGFLVSSTYVDPAWADCSPVATNYASVTCTGMITTRVGTGAETNVTVYVLPNAVLTVRPVAGFRGFGIFLATATVYNFGIISAGNASSGSAYGVGTDIGALAVINSGTISATTTGFGNAFGIYANTASSLVNTGTISGISVGGIGYAVVFGSQADTVTLGTGSKLMGGIDLGGGADKINFMGGNHNLTFASGNLTSAIFTGSSIPYAVSADRAAAIDPTSFAANTALLQSASRVISSLAPDFVMARNDEKSLPGLSYSPAPVEFKLPEGAMAFVTDAPLKGQTTVTTDGTGIWTRFFGGQSYDKAAGSLLGFRNTYYGGAIGIDRAVTPNFRYGGFLGGLSGVSKLALNYGETGSQMGFAGVFARYASDTSFVKVGLQAGYGNNASKRRTNNNLLASGLETATSNFNTWYVSPEASIGYVVALGRFLNGDVSVTPMGQVRYLYGSFSNFSETGGTDNLSISSHTTQSVEERLTSKFSHVSDVWAGYKLKLELIGGVLATQRVSGDPLNGSLLGQSIRFSEPGTSSRKAATAGLSAEVTKGLASVFVAGELIAQPNGVYDYSGRVGVNIRF